MKIIVRSSEHQDIRLHIPTGLGLNPVTAMFLPNFMKQNGTTITRKQALAMVRAVNKYRRSHPSWKLVEVDSANGDHVEIVL